VDIMAVEMVRVDGVDLCVETFGEPGAPPILLMAGAAESMDGWDPDLCRLLAGEGRFVIRYDHRDTGRSTSWPPEAPGYTGRDLVADACGLVDILAGGRAHIVGLSMGGAIAQHLAVEHAELVATLTLISTSPGPADDLPPVADRVRTALAKPAPQPDWNEVDAVVEHIVERYRPYAGRSCFDEAGVREAARRMVARTPNRGASAGNHWLLEGAGDVRSRLGEVRAPALVIHGSEDPLFPPGHGEALASEIPSAELLLLAGVGHQAPPRSTWDVVVPAILRHTDHRVRFAQVFEAEARAHDVRFQAACGVRPRNRVLDIGCGTGGSTREAARTATAGRVVGVDISGVAIEEARRLSEAEGLGNVAYLEADAQVHPFPPAHFDLCISRFGVMFFADPVAAFTNLRCALLPDARLVLLVWQGRDRNEGPRAICQALGAPSPASMPGPDPFSFGDPRTAEGILAAAGFTDVDFDDVHEPVLYGPDVATAFDFVLGLRDTREQLAALDPARRWRARDQLRDLLAAHETETGVLFDARTWIITARRRP
jgi:pimeloyl-ACP methyl ester carboxylesterase/SAM-dependent methyltransferase